MITKKQVQIFVHLLFNISFSFVAFMAVRQTYYQSNNKNIYISIAITYLVATIVINELIKKIFK